MQQTSARPAAPPLRALLIVLLLAGFGLWQAWQCAHGMAASPIAGMPTMNMSITHAGHPDMHVVPDADPGTSHEMPAGVAGQCVTVLAGVAVALLLLIAAEPRLLALLRRMIEAVVRPVVLPPVGPSLTRLCVSRT